MEYEVGQIEIVDINMKFTSMVKFMVKWALAAIPAMFIIFMTIAAIWMIVIQIMSNLALTLP